MRTSHEFAPRTRRFPRLALVAAMLATAAGCDTESLLEVEDPDVTRPEALLDPSNLPAVRATVIGDFSVAFGGSNQTNGLAINTGLFSDEFYHSGTFGQNRELDLRQVASTNGSVATMTRNLYRALRSAQVGVQSYAANQPNTAPHAEMQNLEGYLYVYFAENFCGAVPFSSEVDGEFEYGAPESSQQIYQRAIDAFDEALRIATAAGSVPQQRLALLGKARVLVDLGRYDEAAALVREIPTSFVYSVEYSANTTRQYNGVWGLTHGRREVAMAHNEGGNGLPYRVGTASATNTVVSADPRVPWSYQAGSAAGRSYMHYFQQKYPAQESPIPVASGVMARLIEAEAALNQGQSGAYVPILNELRDGVGLPPLLDPLFASARVDQYFRERAFWQFATGQRLSDLRRLVRQYEREAESVFPTGTYTRPVNTGTSANPEPAPREEGTYDDQVNLPITFDELNNPAFKQAAEQCVTTEA